MNRRAIAVMLSLLAACDSQERRLNEGANLPVTIYDENAWDISQGKKLYESMNCSGCHSKGGGGMGPPLMDDKWIYGTDPQRIFATIVEGRPNGMPPFRSRLEDSQVRQIVAYVRSMSGLASQSASSARDDHMKATPNAQLQRAAEPRPATQP
jgi:cytochrome c oxidase cbb3-type subunit III